MFWSKPTNVWPSRLRFCFIPRCLFAFISHGAIRRTGGRIVFNYISLQRTFNIIFIANNNVFRFEKKKKTINRLQPCIDVASCRLPVSFDRVRRARSQTRPSVCAGNLFKRSNRSRRFPLYTQSSVVRARTLWTMYSDRSRGKRTRLRRRVPNRNRASISLFDFRPQPVVWKVVGHVVDRSGPVRFSRAKA